MHSLKQVIYGRCGDLSVRKQIAETRGTTVRSSALEIILPSWGPSRPAARSNRADLPTVLARMRASRQRPWGRSRPTISAREAIVKVGWVLRREVIDDGRFAAAGRTDTVPGARHPTAAGPTSVGRPDRTPGLGRPAARLPPGVGDRAVRPLAAGATAPAPSWPSVHVACPADRRARPRLTRPERQPSPHVAAACRPPDAGRRRPRYRKGGGTAPPANLDEVDGEARLCVSASLMR